MFCKAKHHPQTDYYIHRFGQRVKADIEAVVLPLTVITLLQGFFFLGMLNGD